MSGHLPQLDREALRRLRETARRLRGAQRRTLPVEELLDLASAARVGPGVTIDFDASRDLGDALIVLRVPAFSHDRISDPRLTILSHREREVAELVARGLSNKRIADRLCIAISTVKDHLHNILRKTTLPNRAAIAAACKGPLDDA
jgi:DNA-binding CsgD family transcriptional regulator